MIKFILLGVIAGVLLTIATIYYISRDKRPEWVKKYMDDDF